MIGYGQTEVGAVGERQAHQVRIVHRVTVVAESHNAGICQLAHLGQFFTPASLGNATDGEDSRYGVDSSPLTDQLHHRGVVYGRFRVGHGAYGCEAAFDSGPGPRVDGLLVLKPRFSEVAVDVDESGAGHHARGLDNLHSLRGCFRGVGGY